MQCNSDGIRYLYKTVPTDSADSVRNFLKVPRSLYLQIKEIYNLVYIEVPILFIRLLALCFSPSIYLFIFLSISIHIYSIYISRLLSQNCQLKRLLGQTQHTLESDETDSGAGGPAPKRRLMDTGQKLLFEVRRRLFCGSLLTLSLSLAHNLSFPFLLSIHTYTNHTLSVSLSLSLSIYISIYIIYPSVGRG